MRLNDHLPSTPPIYTQAQSLLRELVKEVVHSFSVDRIAERTDFVSKDISNYFESYCVKPDETGVVPNLPWTNRPKLSVNEADILNFFISDESNHQVYVLLDHAGRGKSTILKYIVHYLFRKNHKLESRLVPIFISLRTHQNEIERKSTQSELFSFFTSRIKEAGFTIARKYLSVHSDTVLEWISEIYPSPLQGRFPPAIRREISRDVDNFLFQTSKDSVPDMEIIICATLAHMSREKIPVFVIFDDADNFDIDIQDALRLYAEKQVSAGLGMLIAMRHSSWQALNLIRRDVEYHFSPQITWSHSQIKALLKRRLANAQQKIELDSKGYQLETNSQSIVSAFVDLLADDRTTDLLVKTSNHNLHSLMRKISRIPYSWYFSDTYLVRELLVDKTDKQSHGTPLWVAYNLLLGTHSGSFKSDDIEPAEFVNCFCTRDLKHHPFTFFIRLHLLSRLCNHQNQSTSVLVSEIQNEYRHIFQDSLSFTGVFNRTWYRLVRASLVITKSNKRYQDMREVDENILNDRVYISDAGAFYLNWMSNRIDYLYFMKDDIDWPDEFDLEDLKLARVGAYKVERHSQSLIALSKLIELEYLMLESLQRDLTEEGDGRRAILYCDAFSARRASGGRGTIMFTDRMLDEFENYLDWSMKDKPYTEVFAEELGVISRLRTRYQEIENAF